ncbi:hypothetical protein [Labrys sp. ZIDIC5]|uniref:hypothetical protein n=1 Tax=Labrys sedimenti TaxID=3106036 RepID=UPI002ACAECB6|nr:hypothetical protein [Labrys sp. ZIDIC5]MDZ5448636.1 hypothetical protein [Labrys sp. ZIDIC5]
MARTAVIVPQIVVKVGMTIDSLERGDVPARDFVGGEMKKTTVVALAIMLAGCSTTLPVAVVTKGVPGGIMRGTTTAALSGGTFGVSSGNLRCSGSYDAMDTSPTISMPVLCSDGRKGIITATRDNSGMSGGGRFTLNDGTTGDFMFGAAAAKL